jgi:murein DD-endopeptidase MepM/ murein hydrolase activator NlpD
MPGLRRHGLAWMAALAGAATLPGRAPDAGLPPPVLTVETPSGQWRQGGLVVLFIASDRPLEALRITQPAAGVWLERAPGSSGSVFHGLAGIDLETPPGEWPLRLEAVEAGGKRFSDLHAFQVESGRFAVEPLTVDSRYVEPPPSAQRRIERDRRQVAAVWQHPDRDRRWRGPFRDPIEAPTRENFGTRRVLNGQPRAPHNGVDFAAPAGAPILAPAPGRVALASDLYYSGKTVILDHGGGLFTTYFHLSRLDVKAGQTVETGRSLGAVGSTGRVTGPHLHWGARLNGARINPLGLRALPDWPMPAAAGK